MIEFLPDSGLTNLVYMQMALLLGFDYESFTPRFSSYYGPVAVDVQRVRNAVEEVVRGDGWVSRRGVPVPSRLPVDASGGA